MPLKKSNSARERFSTPLAALGIALAFLLLLLALFPEKNILKGIDKTSDLSPVAMNYQESVLRRHPADTALRLRLVHEFLKIGRYEKALKILEGPPKPASPAAQRWFLADRCQALYGMLLTMNPGTTARDRVAQDFSATATKLAQSGASPPQMLRLAEEEQRLGEKKTARAMLGRYLRANALHKGLTDLASFVHAPAGVDPYRERADLYFSAMKNEPARTICRALFMKGVRSMLAGGSPLAALILGEEHLGRLEKDQRTLEFMTNVSLAANRPRLAQWYIKKALGMSAGAKPMENSASLRQ